MVFNLVGTAEQNAIVQRAIDRCEFPFDRLVDGLRAAVGRTSIPVEWADLSRYASARGHGDSHSDVEAHVLEARGRVLGLAWYSGKISIEQSLQNDPELAQEVFLCEAAHMVDFFYMNDDMRKQITSVYHGGNDAEHGHGWFDVGGYNDWVGESWMEGFTLAFTDMDTTVVMTHEVTEEQAQAFRRILGVVDEVPAPEPEFFRTRTGKKYHGVHPKLVVASTVTREEAESQGLKPCRTCKP